MRKLEGLDRGGCLSAAREGGGHCVDLGPSAPPAVQPGGYWVNLGPLLYHWAESWAPQGEQMSIELSLEDVLSVCGQARGEGSILHRTAPQLTTLHRTAPPPTLSAAPAYGTARPFLQLGFDIVRNEMVEAGFMNNKE